MKRNHKQQFAMVLVAIVLPFRLFAQVPILAYNSPQTYTAGIAITALAPTNIGGAIGAPGYGSNKLPLGSGFFAPAGIAVDAAGNVYVADHGSSAVYKIPSGGGSQTTVGFGYNVPNDVAVDAAGNVYVADGFANQIYEVPAGGSNKVGIASGFNRPCGVAVDAAGNVYVADTQNNAIKEIPVGGGTPITLGSNFSLPIGIAVDAAGNVYVADTQNNAVKEIPVGGGATITLATGFNIPTGVAVDAAGNVYVADQNNNEIKEIPAGGGTPVIIGSGFSTPDGIAVDGAGNVYVADSGSQIKEIKPVGGYYISPALPVGLSFNSTTGVITGTPMAMSSAKNYTITAYNIAGSNKANMNITVNVIPVIAAGGVSGSIFACAGTPSSSPNLQQFIVRGYNLTDNVTATAPVGFEISLMQTQGYVNSLTLTPIGSTIDSTLVYVRSAASAVPDSISGNVTLTSTGAASPNVSVKGTINPLPSINTVPNQTVTGGSATNAVNFAASNAINWSNDNPGIGLPASGTGNIASFIATNGSNNPVTATITATPVTPAYAYIANQVSKNVSVINTATNNVESVIPTGKVSAGTAVSPDGSIVYVTNIDDGTLSVINARTNLIVATTTVGGTPWTATVSPDGTRVYVSNNTSNTVSVIDGANNTVIATVPVGLGPYAIVTSPDGSRVYVVNNVSNTLSIIDASNNTVIKTIDIGSSPEGIAISPDGSKLYIAIGSTNSVTVVNTATVAPIATINVGVFPVGVAISPDGKRLYVTNSDTPSDNISIIDVATNTVIATVPVGSDPTGISVTPDNRLIYVTNRVSNTVSVIDATSEAVVSTISVGSFPNSFGNFIGQGAGCNGAAVTFTITVNPALNISTSVASGNISACTGAASSSPNIQQFTVSGVSLTDNIIATAPAGFEVSLAAGSGYGSNITLTQSGGTVSSTIVYVRSAASASSGNISGTVVLTSTGVTSQNVVVTGTVNPLPVINTVSNQSLLNGASTTAVNFTGTANTFNWINNTPGIGLASSGTGNIAPFTAINTGSSPITATITVMPVSSGCAYIANFGNDIVSVINITTNEVIANIPISSSGVAASPDGSRVYITSPGSVSIINTVTNLVISNVALNASPSALAISPDGSRLYATLGGTVAVINTITSTVISYIPGFAAAHGVAVTPDGNRAYVTNGAGNSVSVIDAKADTVITTISIDNSHPSGISVSPDGKRVYVTNQYQGAAQTQGTVSVINTATNSVIAIIPVGFVPAGVAVSPDGARIYVANTLSFNVSVINAATDSVVTTIGVGADPIGISVTPDGSAIYVTNNGSNSVSEISATTNAVIANIRVGVRPSSVGNFITRGTSCPGTPVTFTITVNPSNNARLSALTISKGSLTPAFTPSATTYTASVPNSTSTITMTPTTFDANATVKVNGNTVASGTASGPVTLNVGSNPITTIVTAHDGITTQTYTVTVTRSPSINASLASINPSSGPLTPVFASGTTSYTLSVSNAIATMTVKPITIDANATIKVNGATLASGTVSQAVALAEGSTTTINVAVTAQDGITTKTYIITVTRAPSTDAGLANMALSAGTLNPAFATATATYTAGVPNVTTSITVTPTTTNANATVKVNGTAVSSGTASAPITLNVGQNNIAVLVTAQDGTTTKSYAITVTRGPSTSAGLANLVLSAGTLNPVFATGTSTYTASVSNVTSSITVTPTTADANATVKVNGTAVSSGTASGPIALNVGPNTISVLITAQDGTTTATYTVTVTRVASANANLASMNPGVTPLTPVFAPGTTNYTLTVPNTTASMTVRPVTTDANATMTINGTATPSGTTFGPIALAAGSNTISIIVTAQNGTTTKTYAITVTRAAPGTNSYNSAISVSKQTDTPSLKDDALLVHQGMSPNGDGVNDFLVIDGIRAYPDNKLSIMNRNGQLIYEAKGYDNSSKTFDGHSNKNGRMQLPGTYFYQLDYTVNNVIKHKTGFIVLKY